MDGKVKFAVILLAAVLASTATSYLTTSAYLAGLPLQSSGVVNVDVNNLPPRMVDEISDDVALKRAKQNISVPYVFIREQGTAYVKVNSTRVYENLTITLQWTRLSDNSVQTGSFDYGTHIPAWGDGVVITYGEAPDSYYKAPQTVLDECMPTTQDSYGHTIDGVPELEVLGVFAYI